MRLCSETGRQLIWKRCQTLQFRDAGSVLVRQCAVMLQRSQRAVVRQCTEEKRWPFALGSKCWLFDSGILGQIAFDSLCNLIDGLKFKVFARFSNGLTSLCPFGGSRLKAGPCSFSKWIDSRLNTRPTKPTLLSVE